MANEDEPYVTFTIRERMDNGKVVQGSIVEDPVIEQRNCGCPMDYHMADCPIRTGTIFEPDEEAYYEEYWGNTE